MKVILGYLGPTGSYSEAVCKELYPPHEYLAWQFRQYPTLSSLVKAIEIHEISLALFPMEISHQGLLRDSMGREFLMQLIQSESNVRIVAEKFWPLQLLLLGHEKNKNRIKTVHMNPYVQAHCHTYLSQYPHWQIQIHNSSSEAAKATKEFNHFSHAAIASREAAQEYALTIIDDQLFKKSHEPIMHFIVVTNSEVIFRHENTPTELCISSFIMEIE